MPNWLKIKNGNKYFGNLIQLWGAESMVFFLQFVKQVFFFFIFFLNGRQQIIFPNALVLS